MQDVEREKSMKIDFVDEFAEGESSQNRFSTTISATFFDPPLGEMDFQSRSSKFSYRSSSKKRQELMSTHHEQLQQIIQ